MACGRLRLHVVDSNTIMRPYVCAITLSIQQGTQMATTCALCSNPATADVLLVPRYLLRVMTWHGAAGNMYVAAG